MPFDLQADEARRLVVVTVKGAYDGKLVLEMVTAAREASLARGWHILYDMMAAKPGNMTSAELYWLPRRVPVLGGPEAGRIRVAAIHLPEHAALAGYWETTFRNTGRQVGAFSEEAAAVAWLRS